MLNKDQIAQNRIEFLKLISEISIPGAKIQELVEFLDQGDFFTAPASTLYHNNYEGGLCEHSLNVYHNLVSLYEKFKPNLPYEYDNNTLLICGLLHDISKTNFYESYVMNKKIYSEKGSKSDNQGKFDWFAEQAYKTKEAKDRFLAGTHEENSMLILAKYIPLMEEEMIAIMNHHAGLGDTKVNYDLSAVSNRYPLLPLLHSADYLATFILERK